MSECPVGSKDSEHECLSASPSHVDRKWRLVYHGGFLCATPVALVGIVDVHAEIRRGGSNGEDSLFAQGAGAAQMFRYVTFRLFCPCRVEGLCDRRTHPSSYVEFLLQHRKSQDP
jgi:hypothetical protein